MSLSAYEQDLLGAREVISKLLERFRASRRPSRSIVTRPFQHFASP